MHPNFKLLIERLRLEYLAHRDRGINHYTHTCPESSLILFEVTEEDSYTQPCRGCRKRISESTYGCCICGYFIHKSCAELQLPREIQNFLHPCPLRLFTPSVSSTCDACFEEVSGFTYCCGRCDFHMHVECAQRVPMQSDELIQHFIHRHPLKLLHDPNQHFEAKCRICDKFCSDSDSNSSAYGCEDCNFFVHNSCMISIPQQINHSFHPSCTLILLANRDYVCEGCEEASSGLVFRCGKCDFDLDLKCILLPTTESKGADKIQHPAHEHPLALLKSKEFNPEVQCRACDENCSLDTYFGCSRRRTSCNFFLHIKCAYELQPEIHHPFHSAHPLTLLRDRSYRCRVCDEDGSSLAYCCEECKFQLDLKCAFFPTIESKDADKILHCSHKHPLQLHESNEFGNETRCRSCGKSCLAPCFGCKECNFFLHKTCAVELEEKDICHPFHPLHPLTLSSPPPLYRRDTFTCVACLGSDDWFLLRYRCEECDIDLHIDCINPKHKVPSIKYEGHRHHLTYFDKAHSHVQCNICHDDAQNCFFRCVACAFYVHMYCIPSTPKTIQHQCHLHPLTVTESPFKHELVSLEYDNGSYDHEFYCDACEERRNNFESVYYCAECKFIAEVPCVISEVLPPLLQSTAEETNFNRYGKNSEAIIAGLSREIENSDNLRMEYKDSVERRRVELQELEKKLEEENRKFVDLTNDKFLFEYYLK